MKVLKMLEGKFSQHTYFILVCTYVCMYIISVDACVVEQVVKRYDVLTRCKNTCAVLSYVVYVSFMHICKTGAKEISHS